MRLKFSRLENKRIGYGQYLEGVGNEIKRYGYQPDSLWTSDPLFMKQGAYYFFYHNDHLGTPQKLTTMSGAVAWSATYDAFGKAAVDPSSTIINNLRFPGHYYDQEMGLNYNWNRYYDSVTGRYVTEDPIGFDGGSNFFIYAHNSPQKNVDHNGLYGFGVHYKDTFSIATQAGFDDVWAYGLAKHDDDVDKEYDAWKSKRYRINWHFVTLQRVYELVNKAYSTCNAKDFGQALHALQGYYSHRLQGYTPGRGHAPFHAPDDPATNWDLYFRMREHTKGVMKTFLKKCKAQLSECPF